MPDQPQHEIEKDVKPLSLESAILDVAPRVTESETKPAEAQPATPRVRPLGRISLKGDS